jgi:ABC-type multidrug transport system ATPase subunit
MLAIMGPSGAGKTTLISLISQRSSQGLKVSGEVKFL